MVQEHNKKIVSQFYQKGEGDMPVILVALGAAIIVAILVALFLVLLPNRNLRTVLLKYEAQLESRVKEEQEILNRLPKFKEELQGIEEDTQKFRNTLIQDPKEIKNELEAVFRQFDFQVKAYNLGPSHAGVDEWWIAYPVDFQTTGPKGKFPKAIEALRSKMPVTVRLLEVDIKRKERKKENSADENIEANFILRAHFLIPFEDLPRDSADPFKPTLLPDPGFFESKKLRKIRDHIRALQAEIRHLESSMGEVATLKMKKRRLIAIRDQRAEFTGKREREFDSFESQLKGMKNKLEKDDVYRIIIKVKETYVEDKNLAEAKEGAE
jgi:hypothetical protein